MSFDEDDLDLAFEKSMKKSRKAKEKRQTKRIIQDAIDRMDNEEWENY